MRKEDFSDYVLALIHGYDLWDKVKYVSFNALQYVLNAENKLDHCDFYATKNGCILEIKEFTQLKPKQNYEYLNYHNEFVYVLDEDIICLRSELQ